MKLKHILITTLLSTATLIALEQFPDGFCNKLTLTIPSSECQVLEIFWNSTNGEDWTQNDGWGYNTDVSSWYGVVMQENNDSVRGLNIADNSLTGEIPEELSQIPYMEGLIFDRNNISGTIPKSLETLTKLFIFSVDENNLTGSLPKFSNMLGMRFLSFSKNNFTGSIPNEWSNFLELELLLLDGNNLSGPLPDLSKTQLPEFIFFLNQFSFTDIEPQMDWIENITSLMYMKMNDINESKRIIYFDKILRIEPQLAENPTGNDHYSWIKSSIVSTILSTNRVYVKENTTLTDEGYYNYEIVNSKVTREHVYGSKQYGGLHLYSSGHPDAIASSDEESSLYAEHDNTPTVTNLIPITTISEGETYTYSSDINDSDEDALVVRVSGLPIGLTFAFDADSFTIEGIPTQVGSYDINITVVDLDEGRNNAEKIPVHINYTLHVNPSEDTLPTGFTFANDTYTHTATGNTFIGEGSVAIVNDGLELTQSCVDNKMAYISIDSSGVLSTGFKDCTSDLLSDTFTDPLPNNTKASIVTNNNEKMILIELPLDGDMTLEGN